MDIITPHDEQTIYQWATRQVLSPITYIADNKDSSVEKFNSFLEKFKILAPQVQIRKAPDESFASPAIIIGRHKNIAYQVVPQGKELSPFLDALSTATEDITLSEQGIEPADSIQLPAHLLVFIALQCPHCPYIVSQLLSLADKNPTIRLTIVDVFLFENKAKENDIRSVPTLVLDNTLRWTGNINMTEVIRQCIQRDPATISAASIRQIIEDGDAARVSEIMTNCNLIFPAFIDLLVHERWSVRLGAMVTVEYLAEDSPELAASLFSPLRDRFTDLDPSVQGDVVQVLAQLKNKDVKEYLKKIASGDYAESVKQAAGEELSSF